MDQSEIKSTMAVVEWIQALKWQRQLNEVIKIEISKEMRKSDFNEQQIKDVFINV